MRAESITAGDDSFMVALASAIHELRTPLSVITGFAGLIQERWDDADRDDLAVMVGALARNAERMNRLVDELIALASAHREVVVLDLMEVDLRDLLRAASLPALAHGLSVELHCPAALSMRTDAYQVEQIVATLVDNARCHGRPPVLMTAEAVPSGISITIRDGGPTIPANRVSRLFEPFSVESANASHGLGLYTALCSARRLGGNLKYIPSGGGGAFVLTLPQS